MTKDEVIEILKNIEKKQQCADEYYNPAFIDEKKQLYKESKALRQVVDIISNDDTEKAKQDIYETLHKYLEDEKNDELDIIVEETVTTTTYKCRKKLCKRIFKCLRTAMSNILNKFNKK